MVKLVCQKKARELFHIHAGDTLIIVGDEERGLAIVPHNYMSTFFANLALFSEENTQDENGD